MITLVLVEVRKPGGAGLWVKDPFSLHRERVFCFLVFTGGSAEKLRPQNFEKFVCVDFEVIASTKHTLSSVQGNLMGGK